MTTLLGQFVRNFVCLVAIIIVAACSSPEASRAAPYAAFVQDARTGEVLHAENADTRLHPASLTKMMTLYIAFEEIEKGNISLDTLITVSKNAASKPPSRLGLKAGQKIALRYLIRAAAIKSANDAASAIGDAIGGDEAKFAARMTRTAKALGMNNTTFKNANGLTAKGHLSTARDMTTLGRRLFYDFPQYYNIFSRRTTDAGMAQVRNTNTRFLDAYEGADGIKTGYTVPAGFNLTASAERNGVRIIATVFGGASTAARNAKVAQLLDLGFRKAPKTAPTTKPAAPTYQADEENALVAEADGLPEVEGGAAKTIRLQTAVATSPRPLARPSAAKVAAASEAVAAIQDDIAAAVAEAAAAPPAADSLDAQAVALAEIEETVTRPEARPEATLAEAELAPVEDLTELADAGTTAVENPAEDTTEVDEVAVAEVPLEMIAPASGTLEAQAAALAIEPTLDAQAVALAALPEAAPAAEAVAEAAPLQLAAVAQVAAPAPPKRKAPIFESVEPVGPLPPESAPQVIRLSTSNARHFGVNLGKFNSRSEAERILLKTQLAESATLNEGLRKVVQRGGAWHANFMGLTQEQADLACRRLQARGTQCFTLAP
ncbi:D-alanyl-D-alanine carboxypeptidase family protein [Thioclava sp. FR2]|uniref:D-alanyl-D-alanine carboxypeptidase family protein n=1 Tax=Thioclava sp. FR2 TaxID=3445780 RepID=UPI003EBF16DE